jgi:hypothetical protein
MVSIVRRKIGENPDGFLVISCCCSRSPTTAFTPAVVIVRIFVGVFSFERQFLSFKGNLGITGGVVIRDCKNISSC